MLVGCKLELRRDITSGTVADYGVLSRFMAASKVLGEETVNEQDATSAGIARGGDRSGT